MMSKATIFVAVSALTVLFYASAAPHDENYERDENFEQREQSAEDEIGRQPEGKSQLMAGVIGRRASISTYPYTVSIKARNYHFGTGVILNKRWILTNSFPPVGEIPENVEIRAGSDSVDSGGQTIGATKLFIHPERDSWINDVALIKLNSTLNYSKTVKAIKLATKIPKKHTKGVVPGFGYSASLSNKANKNKDTFTRDGYLRVANLKYLPYKDCDAYYRETVYHNRYTNKSFCTVPNSSTGPCYYDYGSPFVAEKKVVGVFSNVPECVDSSWPPVFTDVYKLKNWIIYTMRENTDKEEINELENDIQYYE